MDTATVVSLIALTASLFLVTRGLRADGLSFESKAWMAAAWLLIISVLSFVLGRMGA